MQSSRTGYWITTLIAWLIVAVVAFPLVWMIVSALKKESEVVSYPPLFFPSEISFESFERLFAGDFLIWFGNSIIVAFGTIAIVVVLGTLGAYSITRFRFRGRQSLSAVVLLTYLFPSVLMIVPLFIIVARLGLSDTLIALMLANTTFSLPFAIWLLRSYFLAVPIQVEEAAMIDGASRLRAFVDVVIPQVRPGLISTAIFTFILAWDDYLFASIFISSGQNKTLPIGISSYANELSADWGVLMAASVCVTIPVLTLFTFLQSRLLPDLNAGAVKA